MAVKEIEIKSQLRLVDMETGAFANGWPRVEPIAYRIRSGQPIEHVEPGPFAMLAAWAGAVRAIGGAVELHDSVKGPYAYACGLLTTLVGSTRKPSLIHGQSPPFQVHNTENSRADGFAVVGADIGLHNIETDGAFAKAYSEALNNVAEHAESEDGAQIAASHFGRAGRMTFSVADRGIGIVAHLKRRHGAGYDDPELLQMALEPAVSGTFGLGEVSGRTHYGISNAGLGLYVMRNIAQKSKGSLTVVTGEYVAQVGADGNVAVRSCEAPWAGTALCISYQTARTNDAMTAIQDAMNVAVHPNRKQERITFNAAQVGSNAVQVRLQATYGAAIADKQQAIRLRDEELLPAIRDNRNVIIDLTDGAIIAHSCAHALLYQVIVEAGPASRSRVCVKARTRQIRSVVRQVSYFAGDLDE